MVNENLCLKIQKGDLIISGNVQFQVFSKRKPHIRHLAIFSDSSGNVFERDGDDFINFVDNRVVDYSELKEGTKFALKQHYIWSAPSSYIFNGFITVATLSIKSVPLHYRGGELDRRNFKSRVLSCLIEGSSSAYEARIKDAYYRNFPLEFTAIIPAQISIGSSVNIKGFFKNDLIAYVIYVNGEGKLDRSTILKRVAFLEGKPWIPSSNSSYFSNVPDKTVTSGLLRKAAKGRYGRIFYGLGFEGKERAIKVLARLGPDVGRV